LNANLSGGGSIIADMGAGTLILIGNNTYSGGTTLTSGFVSINNNSALGTGLLTFNGGVLFNVNPAGVTLANPLVVTAAGGTIAGSQNITLAGNGNLSGELLNSNSTTTTLSGNLSGGGSITQTSGLMILTGINSYTGGTVVTGGVLQGNTNSLQGNILNDASVVFDQNFTGTYAGVMSGTGSLTKQNIGTLILTGANTYSGGTIVSAGVLQGNSTSVQGNILNNASVVFDQNINGAYTGVMSGTGTVIKQGTGVLALTNNNLYTGLTTVNAGTLLVDGSLADSVTVNSGGTLGGTGIIAGAVINNSGGTVSPGNQNIGTLRVGSFFNAPGSTLGIEFNGTQTALLDVTPGLATITGSTVAFTPQVSAYFPGTTYTFLTATGGVVGQFGTVTFTNNNLGPLQTQVIYNPNSIQLRILGPFNPDLPCLTPNQRSVVQFFNTLPFQAGTDLGEILTILAALDPCGANGPFEQISSAETAATYWVLADDIAQTHLVNTRRLDILRHFKKAQKRCEQQKSLYADNLPHSGYAAGDLWPKKITRKQRMQKRIVEKKRAQEQDCSQAERHIEQQLEQKAYVVPKTSKASFLDMCGMPEGDVWVRGFGNKLQQNTLPNSRAFDSKNSGFLLGMDFDVSEEWFFGFSGGKVFSHLDWKGNRDKAHINTALGSLYASWFNDCGLYMDSSLVAGDSNYTVSRNLNFSTLSRHALGNYRGFTISPYGGAGYVFDLTDSLDTEIFANVEYIDIRRNAYVEKGAGSLNLAVRSKQVGFLRSEAGVGLTNLVECDIVSFLVKTKLSYVNKRQTQKGTLIAGLVGFPGTFTVSSYTQPKHQAAVGIGLYCQFYTSGFWSVFYDAEFGSNAMMHAGSARIGFLF
jgi:autotransporter-associated beta strand protein